MPLQPLLQFQAFAVLRRAAAIAQQRHIKRQRGLGGMPPGDASLYILLGA